MTTTHSNREWVEKARGEHHAALKAMLPADDMRSGFAFWRQLHRLELQANRLACDLCNGDVDQEKADAAFDRIKEKVRQLFGGTLPNGFFINRDPRGYALKLENNSVPYRLHKDMGGYQILAPQID